MVIYGTIRLFQFDIGLYDKKSYIFHVFIVVKVFKPPKKVTGTTFPTLKVHRQSQRSGKKTPAELEVLRYAE